MLSTNLYTDSTKRKTDKSLFLLIILYVPFPRIQLTIAGIQHYYYSKSPLTFL